MMIKQCLLTQLFVPLIPLVDSRFQAIVIPSQLHQGSFHIDQSPGKLLLFVLLADVSSNGGVPGLQGFVEIVVFDEENEEEAEELVKTLIKKKGGLVKLLGDDNDLESAVQQWNERNKQLSE